MDEKLHNHGFSIGEYRFMDTPDTAMPWPPKDDEELSNLALNSSAPVTAANLRQLEIRSQGSIVGPSVPARSQFRDPPLPVTAVYNMPEMARASENGSYDSSDSALELTARPMTVDPKSQEPPVYPAYDGLEIQMPIPSKAVPCPQTLLYNEEQGRSQSVYGPLRRRDIRRTRYDPPTPYHRALSVMANPPPHHPESTLYPPINLSPVAPQPPHGSLDAMAQQEFGSGGYETMQLPAGIVDNGHDASFAPYGPGFGWTGNAIAGPSNQHTAQVPATVPASAGSRPCYQPPTYYGFEFDGKRVFSMKQPPIPEAAQGFTGIHNPQSMNTNSIPTPYSSQLSISNVPPIFLRTKFRNGTHQGSICFHHFAPTRPKNDPGWFDQSLLPRLYKGLPLVIPVMPLLLERERWLDEKVMSLLEEARRTLGWVYDGDVLDWGSRASLAKKFLGRRVVSFSPPVRLWDADGSRLGGIRK